jgi:hypothetical protein
MIPGMGDMVTVGSGCPESSPPNHEAVGCAGTPKPLTRPESIAEPTRGRTLKARLLTV